MRISVIMCAYNNEPLVRRTLEALRKTASPFTEVIVVDNESPDERTKDLIYKLDWIKVVTPGKNLGCHNGWEYGYKFSTGAYVCKLDDDTEILTPGWGEKMTAALQMVPGVGFISADIDAKQANQYEMVDRLGHRFEVARNGVVGFSFVMFRRQDIERWGGMKTGQYLAAGGKVIAGERLYGGEEVYLATAARSEGKMIAHFPAVKCHHMDNEDRHPHYAAWKNVYGYRGWTSKDMAEWIESGDYKIHYRMLIEIAALQRMVNDAELVLWLTQLVEFCDSKDLKLIDLVMSRTKNGHVHLCCEKISSKING